MKRGAMWVLAFGVVATACAAPVEPTVDAPAVSDGTTRTESGATTIATTTSPVTATPTSSTTASTLSVRACTPTYVIRETDTDGHYYGYTDGFTVPFPTPWLTLQDPAPEGYSYDPDGYYYEEGLNEVPSHVDYEWKVRDIVVTSCLAPNEAQLCLKGAADHDYFVVGFTNAAYESEAKAVASALYGQQSDVQAEITPCTYVFDGALNDYTTPLTEVAYFPFADQHDPSHHPI
jgi:hypothetical protein